MIHNGSGNSKSSPNAVDNGLRENGWCNGWVNIADQLSRGLQNLNPACRVRFFFSTSVYGLTNYVIRHNIQIRKYVIITVLFFFERMHMHCKPMFWVPGPVPHMLGSTKNEKKIVRYIGTKSSHQQNLILILFAQYWLASGHTFLYHRYPTSL